MRDKYIHHIRGDSVNEKLRVSGHWIVASIDQSFGWPKENLIILYEGFELFILGYQSESDLYPGIAVKLSEKMTGSKAKEIIPKFLSCINWVNDGFIRIKSWSGGNLPSRMGGDIAGKHLTTHFRLSYIPSGLTSDAYLALALFREGNALRFVHPGYSFLSYYKIINLINRKGAAQKKWIKQNLKQIGHDGKKRKEELEKDGCVVEDYLYHSCRCALAHAGTDPTVNPDDVDDNVRFHKDLPLIRDLAHEVIKINFLVATRQEIYRKHLYELSGFKEYLPKKILKRIIEEESFEVDTSKWKQISIRQWCDKRYGVLENLYICGFYAEQKQALMQCRSKDGFFKIQLILDFAEERLHIDANNVSINKEANEKACDYAIDMYRYLKDLVLNGSEEVWDNTSNKCLGRKDPNIPVNIDLGRTIENFDRNIEALQRHKKDITNQLS